MSKVAQAWTELMKMPAPDQELAAEAILSFAESRRGPHLTDEQVAEVERRLADPDEPTISMQEVRARLKTLGA